MANGGIILGALGGASDAILRGMDADRDQANAMERMRYANSLDLQKAQALEALKNAPLNRLQSRAQTLAGQEVPQEAAPVTSLSGVYASDAGPSMGGFQGGFKSIQAAINNMPEGDDKQAAIAQLKNQLGQAKSMNAAAVEGMTRKRTPEEALEAAVNESKVSDLPAYLTGKAVMGDKTITIPEGSTVIDRTGKVIFSSADTKAEKEREREDRKDARMAAQEDARDARQQKYLDARERLAEIRGGKSDGVSREERLRYTSLFNESGRRMSDIQKSINTLRRDPMYSMAKAGSPQKQELDDLQSQLKTYQEERSLYGRLLSGSQTGDTNPPPAVAESTPAPAQVRPPLSSFQKK